MEMRLATPGDIPRVMEIMAAARLYQRACGFVQWEDGYPSGSDRQRDIDRCAAWVFVAGGEIMGYASLAVGDASYDEHPGLWRYAGEYGVIHRLALAPQQRGKGRGEELFLLMENEYRDRGIRTVRADTGAANVVMQRLLTRCGYEPRGQCAFTWGDRLAYEKPL